MGVEPPGFVTDLVAGELADPQVNAYLYAQGQRLGDAVAGKVGSLLPGAAAPSAAAPSAWVSKLVQPILAPVQAGATDRVKTRLGPLALGVALGVLGLGFVLGRASK